MSNNIFSPRNWYWIVAGSTTQVFSSASGGYVPVADATYQAWLAAGHRASRIASEAELGEVLAQHDLKPVAAAVLDAYKDKVGERLPIRLLFKVLFNLENRVRALEGQPSVTQVQYRNALKNLAD